MNKDELRAELDKHGVKYQDNDTNTTLGLMLEAVNSRATITQLNAEKKQLADQKEALTIANKDLQELLEAKEVEAQFSDKTVVDVAGKKYIVIGAVKLDGKLMSKEELAADKKACARLVKEGSGILQIVE